MVQASEEKKEWWRGASIYQIYPRSFKDSNMDGIGDLGGIIQGLDHISYLGVDAIWICPFFTSPMDDFGYDVSDYCGIDPMFGNFDDFDKLINKSHELGLKVIIDQVYSHTSDKHAWFEESRSSRNNPKADWYVWADPKSDGSPPSNWQSVFGGSSWAWDGRRKQYYLHNFLTSQPDLNVHNTQVQEAILNVTKFWLNRGVDGFRLDAMNFSMHDPNFTDNPPNGAALSQITRPFDMQETKYNMGHENIPKFLERIRNVIDQYPGEHFTVAEVGGPPEKALEEMKLYTKGNHRLNSAYNFDFLYATELTSTIIKNSVGKWSNSKDEWPSWELENHDTPRAISRWFNKNALTVKDYQKFSKLTLLLLVSLRGNPIIYQGQELGLTQSEVAFEDLQDPEAIANWPNTLGRDGARTPLPWENDKINNGFSEVTPWLRADENHESLAIKLQSKDSNSPLNFIKKVLKLRKRFQALIDGGFEILPLKNDCDLVVPEEIFAFIRSSETDYDDHILCVFNLSETDIDWFPNSSSINLDSSSILVNTYDKNSEMDSDNLNNIIPRTISAYSGYWAKISFNPIA